MATCGKCGKNGASVAEIRACYGGAEEVPAALPEITEGFWVLDGWIYKVQRAVHGSGQLYAKRANVEGGFDYVPGALRTLREGRATPLTKENAAEFGKLYGVCCICGRTLTNEESIEAGIGPVCSGKQGW